MKHGSHINSADFIRAHLHNQASGEHGSVAVSLSTTERLKMMEEALFSFLHDVQVDVNVNKVWLYIMMAFNFLQMLYFPLSQSPMMPWQGKSLMNSIYVILSPITFASSRPVDASYSLILFYVASAWTALLVALCSWGTLLWSSDALGGGYRPSWLPRVVRILLRLNNTCLTVPALASLLAPVGCQGTWVVGPCWMRDHLGVAIAGAVMAPFYVILCVSSALLLVQRKQSTKNLQAAPHGRVLALVICVQCIVTLIFTFHKYLSSWVLIMASLIFNGALLYLFFSYLPYLAKEMNNIYCAKVSVSA
jgi:hypothetical protein